VTGPDAGTVNTGGGGGGRYQSGVSAAGANGGSGVVIIAYPDTFALAAATTGSPTVDSSSRAGFHVYTFTGSGSITF
jgi:hypothetical protein